MLNIGCHLSCGDGYYKMGLQAVSLGANTFQFFTRNPRGFKAKEFDAEDCKRLVALMKENGFAPVVAHAPYTLNPASSDERIQSLARQIFADDLKILENIPDALYNFHPGSHVKTGDEKGMEQCIKTLNEVLLPDEHTTVLIECMAGKGSEIGRTFEQVKEIIDGVELKSRVGVCIDTCHIFDAGYDITDSLDGVLEEFDKIIGASRLRAVHLNDSMNERGSRKDRHEKIGEGKIGLPALIRVINHPTLRQLPFILETPNDIDGYKKEIELLRENFHDSASEMKS